MALEGYEENEIELTFITYSGDLIGEQRVSKQMTLASLLKHFGRLVHLKQKDLGGAERYGEWADMTLNDIGLVDDDLVFFGGDNTDAPLPDRTITNCGKAIRTYMDRECVLPVQILLQKVTATNRLRIITSPNFKVGCSALEFAARAGLTPLVELFLTACGDIEINHQYNALHVAVKWGRHDCVRVLLSHGVSVDILGEQTMDGLLHVSARSGHISTALTLLHYLANPHHRNSDGLTFIDLARSLHKDEFVAEITSYLQISEENVTQSYLVTTAFATSQDSPDALEMWRHLIQHEGEKYKTLVLGLLVPPTLYKCRELAYRGVTLPLVEEDIEVTVQPQLNGDDDDEKRPHRLIYSLLLLELALGFENAPMQYYLNTLALSTPLPQRFDVLRYAVLITAPLDTSPLLTAWCTNAASYCNDMYGLVLTQSEHLENLIATHKDTVMTILEAVVSANDEQVNDRVIIDDDMFTAATSLLNTMCVTLNDDEVKELKIYLKKNHQYLRDVEGNTAVHALFEYGQSHGSLELCTYADRLQNFIINRIHYQIMVTKVFKVLSSYFNVNDVNSADESVLHVIARESLLAVDHDLWEPEQVLQMGLSHLHALFNIGVLVDFDLKDSTGMTAEHTLSTSATCEEHALVIRRQCPLLRCLAARVIQSAHLDVNMLPACLRDWVRRH